LVLLAAGLAGALVAVGRAATPVFRAGERLVSIVVGPDAAPVEREAAAELARVLGLMSGLEWQVERRGETSHSRGIHVGRTDEAVTGFAPLRPAADLLAPRPGEIGVDGFRIRSSPAGVFVEGATAEAAAFAVSWLLQSEAGVRWFVPGAEGEMIPRRGEWVLPDLDVTREPAYVSREIYGLGSPDEQAWARRLGLRRHLEFGHALAGVFSPELLETNRDWAPELLGERHRPAGPDDFHWQPNLALPAVARHAARAATDAFAREPERASFSLAINDSVRFDQSEATREWVAPLRYFRGRPDYSPLVFAFMNRAAALVAQTTPNRYLGCLAYFWCENVPGFPVHPQVVPFLTADRTQYYDAQFRAADLELMSSWRDTGVRAFGLWDYGEGVNFLVPRVPVSALAEAVREGWTRGARGYFGEIVPQWGFDAFKVWALARLLWEPQLTTRELEDEFYPGYYGPAAGPMRRFFAACEERWMMQSGPPYWLKYYEQEDQALLFGGSACVELRTELAAAARAVAREPVLAARVARTARAFAVTEALVAFDAERRSLSGWDAESSPAPGSQGGLAAAINRFAEKRAALVRAFDAASAGELPAMKSTRLDPFLRHDPVPRLLWAEGRLDPARPRALLAAAGPRVQEVSEWAILADAIAGRRLDSAGNVVRNPSLEQLAATGLKPEFLHPRSSPVPADWEVRAMPTEHGRVARVETDGGFFALRMEGAWDTQAFQWHPAVPRRIYVATVETRGATSPGGDAGLFLTFLTADGRVTGTHRMQTLPKGTTSQWRTLALADLAPSDAAWVGIGVGASRQVGGDWLEAAALDLREMDTSSAW
jgi:hypothetical protein